MYLTNKMRLWKKKASEYRKYVDFDWNIEIYVYSYYEWLRILGPWKHKKSPRWKKNNNITQADTWTVRKEPKYYEY